MDGFYDHVEPLPFAKESAGEKMWRRTAEYRLVFKLTFPTQLFWLLIYGLIAVVGYSIVGIRLSHAEDPYANSPNREWYRQQLINPEAQARLKVAWKSCCEKSEVFRTNFRVNKADGEDEWWYQLPNGNWKLIPPDTVHWGETAPDGQPTLFIYSGIETCFYPGLSGG